MRRFEIGEYCPQKRCNQRVRGEATYPMLATAIAVARDYRQDGHEVFVFDGCEQVWPEPGSES